MITLTIPNDDHIALRAFGKALEEMALAHGAEPRKTVGELLYKLNIDTTEATAALERLNVAADDLSRAAPQMMGEPEIDTTAQQVESLAAPDNDLPIITVNPTCHALSNEELQERGFDSTGTPWDERIHSASKALNADGTWRLRRKPKDIDEAEWAVTIQRVQDELRFPQEPVPVTPPGDSEFVVDPYDTYEEGELPPVAVVEPPVTHQNPAYMYQESRNVYALGRSKEEIAEYETKGYVRHTQEQYDAWEGPTVADDGDDFHTDADVVTEQTVAGIPPLPVPPPVTTATLEMHLPVPPHVIPVTVRVVDDVQWDFPHLMAFLTERHGKIDVATVNTLLAQDGMSSVQELNAHPDKIGPFVARVKAHLGE